MIKKKIIGKYLFEYKCKSHPENDSKFNKDHMKRKKEMKTLTI